MRISTVFFYITFVATPYLDTFSLTCFDEPYALVKLSDDKFIRMTSVVFLFCLLTDL